jgi:hypothetical protein
MTPISTKRAHTYSDTDFERIAEAIGKKGSDVLEHGSQFEAAAVWFRLDSNAPNRLTPSRVRKKLDQISNSARRLLHNLGIDDLTDAPDGPGDITIFDLIASVDGVRGDDVTRATARLGRLVEILDGIEVAWELDRLALEASDNVIRLGQLTVHKGHLGDAKVNDWIASMMSVYAKVTGEDPATSVGAPGESDEGISRGPLIRFLEASGAPLGIEYGSDAWRSRVRTILDNSP